MELPDFSSAHVLVLGDIMLDRYIWGDVERISPEAPIPVVHVHKRTVRLGGAGNVAANLAGLECQTTLVGAVGTDKAAEDIAALLQKRGIDDASVASTGVPTVTKTRVIAGSQQLVRLDEECPEGLPAAVRQQVWQTFCKGLAHAQAVVLSDYGKGLLQDDFVRDCVAACRQQGIPLFVDPKRTDWTVYAGSSCVTPNLKEFGEACERLQLDAADMEGAGSALISHYNLSCLLLTRGKAGMSLLRREDSVCSAPSVAREVFDVSGAGDTVIALMAASAAAGLDMATAMQLANLAAGEVVGHVGTYAVSRSDLLRACARNAANQNASAVYSWDQAQSMVADWQQAGQTVAFTNGCFDILHPGHISLLQQAKARADKLVVGLNTDASIKRLKGEARPILPAWERAAMLTALDCVDIVVTFGEDTPYKLIETLRPDVLVKGSDYQPADVVGADLVTSWGGKVALVELVSGQSTTNIVARIRESIE